MKTTLVTRLKSVAKQIILTLATGVVFLLPNISLAASPVPIPGHEQIITQVTSTSHTSLGFGSGSTRAGDIYYKLVSPNTHFICSITASFSKTGSPTDSITVDMLRGGDASSPSGSYLYARAANLVLASDLSGGETAWNFYFDHDNCYSIGGGEIMWFKFHRTAALNTTNYYQYYYGGTSTNTLNPGTNIKWSTYSTEFGANSDANPAIVTEYGIPDLSIYPVNTSTSALSDATTRCDTGNWSDSICFMFSYLFIPQNSVVTQWSNLSTQLAVKFPFAYLYDAWNAVTEAENTAGDNFPSLNINMSTSAIPIDVAIFNGDTVVQYAGEDNVNTFKDIMKYSIYFSFGVMVFFTIKNLIKS